MVTEPGKDPAFLIPAGITPFAATPPGSELRLFIYIKKCDPFKNEIFYAILTCHRNFSVSDIE